MKRISVVICTYNRVDFIERCVQSVLSQEFDNYEIIIVDDGSADGTSDLIKKFLNNTKVKIYWNKENLGLMRSRNIGAENADSEIVAFIDSDSITERLWLKKLSAVFDIDPNIMIAGGEILDGLLDNYWALACKGLYKIAEKEGYVDKIFGGNMAIRRDFLLKYKFDEMLKYGADEKDLCWRARRDGFKIYFKKDAKVMHFHRHTLLGLIKQRFLIGVGNSCCSLKNKIFPFLYIKSFIILFFLFSILVLPKGLKGYAALFLISSFVSLIIVEDVIKKEKSFREILFTLPARILMAVVESVGDLYGLVRWLRLYL